MKSLHVFLTISVIVAVTTIFAGLFLITGPNWHFTFADIIVDISVGIVFGILAIPSVSYWINRGTGRQSGYSEQVEGIIVFAILGILAVFSIEGGGALSLTPVTLDVLAISLFFVIVSTAYKYWKGPRSQP